MSTTPRLIILAGIPGSGKSTYAQTHYPNVRVVSSDAIREEMGDVYDQTRNQRVFNTFHQRIAEKLAQGSDVIADSTALDEQARANLVSLAQVFKAEAHLVLFANIGQAVVRNRQRERVVPDNAMARMLDKFERTLLSLPKESQAYSSVTVIQATDRTYTDDVDRAQ